MWLSLTIFAFTYLVVSGQRIPEVRLDRPSAALCGAVLMVLSGSLTLEEAYAAVHLETLVLLLGMMVISAYLAEGAFFRTLAYYTAVHAHTPKRLLWSIVLVAGVLSALLVNDTVCLMMTPIVLAVVVEAKLPPLPYLMALTTASNIGGVMTLAGNPQNMIIATSSGLSYGRYFLRMLPVGVLGLIADALLLLFLFRKELRAATLATPTLVPHISPPPFNRALVAKALFALGVVVVGFSLGKPMAAMAMVGAALLTLIARTSPHPVFARIDGSLLLFFSGLFVVVEGARKTGVLGRLHDALLPLFGTSASHQLVAFGLFSELGSNLFSNVPFVLAARDWVPQLAHPELQWTSLAMTSTLAGNLTLFGSVANLIVFEMAGKAGGAEKVGFFRFFRYGIVITAVTTAIGLATVLALLRLQG